MDGRGRVYDNMFVERLWRTVKYEEVYLHDYSMVLDAHNGMTRYFLFYNRERLHTSLGNRTPHEVYFKQPIPLNPRQAYQIMHQIHPTFLS
jgi:putative transposase